MNIIIRFIQGLEANLFSFHSIGLQNIQYATEKYQNIILVYEYWFTGVSYEYERKSVHSKQKCTTALPTEPRE